MRFLSRNSGKTGRKPQPDFFDSGSKRYWNASATNRLNETHWLNARDTNINEYITSQLSTLRARSRYEARNNAFVKGVIGTHVIDIAGDRGPMLQVQSTSKRFAKSLEKAWASWWDNCDYNGQISGLDMLHQNIASFWTCGESLQVIAFKDGEPKLSTIDPKRMAASFSLNSTTNYSGMVVNENGRPKEYLIDAPSFVTGYSSESIKYSPEQVIHCYLVEEQEQLRGIPWLAACLQAIADLADYDDQVMDAARAAAMMGLYFFSKEMDTEPKVYSDAMELERNLAQFAPPGWEPKQLQPGQPAANYDEYHASRLRLLGRHVGMPLMMIMLDSAKHSYSSARFDAQVYQRGNKKLQRWIERIFLNRLVRLLAREQKIMGGLATEGDFTLRWQWPTPAHVDPLKEAEASTERLNNCTSTLRDECSNFGLDWEEVIDQRALENELLKSKGLPPIGLIPKKEPKNATTDA